MREISHSPREQRRIHAGIASQRKSTSFSSPLAAIIADAAIESSRLRPLGLGDERLRVQQMERGEEGEDDGHNRLQIGLSEPAFRVRSRESWILRTNYYSIHLCTDETISVAFLEAVSGVLELKGYALPGGEPLLLLQGFALLQLFCAVLLHLEQVSGVGLFFLHFC